MDTNLPITQRLDPFGAKVNTGVNDLFTAFLGPPPGPSRTDPYEKRSVDKWNMPENYKGQNLYLRDTIEDWMFTADQTWYTEKILPWRVTDQVNLQWTQFEANAHFMDYTPYQTTSRLTTQKRNIRRAQLVRRGIAAEFEHDFIKTALGRTSFLATLGQMARSVQETANAEVIRALLHAHHFQNQWLRDHGIIRENDLASYLDRDKDRFALVQKTKNGLEKLDMEVNKEMQAYQGRANAWIIPEEVSIYATIVPKEKTDYYIAGQNGPDRVNNARRNVGLAQAGTTAELDRVEPLHMVRNVPVYVARSFHVDNVGKEDLLSRTRQIGEFNTMFHDCSDYSTYTSASRDISIYNEDIDDFSKISLRDAVENCGLWDGNDLRVPTPEGRNRDVMRDFLTKTDTGRSVGILGDIDPFYLPAKVLVGMAQARRGGNTAYGRMGDIVARAEAQVPVPVYSALADEDQSVFRAFASDIGSLVSSNRTMFPTGFTPEIAYEMALQNVAPVVRSDGAAPVGASVDSSELDNAFFQTLQAQVPRAKRPEIQAIIDGQGTVMERAEQIRTRIEQYVEDKVKGIPKKWTSKAPVSNWFKTRVEQYQEAKSQVQDSPRSVSVQGDIAGYMPCGQDLTGTGFQFVHASSSRPSQRAVDRVCHFRRILDAAETAKSQSNRPVGSRAQFQSRGAGMGLAGIGQLDYGDVDAGQAVPDARLRDIVERGGIVERLLKHAANIEASGTTRSLKTAARSLLNFRITKSSILSLVDRNIPVPMNFLLLRPHQQYKMRIAIKCATDGGSGNTFIGHSDMQIQHEAGRKIGLMHYTTHMRAVVTQPKNVYVQPDVFSEEYEGGAGARFYTPDTYKTKDLENLKYSLICVALPVIETDIPSPMDISGRFYTEYAMGLLTKSKFEELHYSTAYRYNQLYDFHNAQGRSQGVDTPGIAPGRAHINRICYQGHQWMFNPKTNAFDKVRTNKGHWSKNVYAGCGEVRRGKNDILDTVDFTRYATL